MIQIDSRKKTSKGIVHNGKPCVSKTTAMDRIYAIHVHRDNLVQALLAEIQANKVYEALKKKSTNGCHNKFRDELMNNFEKSGENILRAHKMITEVNDELRLIHQAFGFTEEDIYPTRSQGGILKRRRPRRAEQFDEFRLYTVKRVKL